MTKIVVVVGRFKKEVFTGNIEARTNEGTGLGPHTNVLTEPTLFIYDKDSGEQIASFPKYDYWRYTD